MSNFLFNDFFKDIEQKVKGYFFIEEAKLLFDTAMSLPENSTIVEVGSYFGKSTCFLIEAARRQGHKVFSVDNFTIEGEIAKPFFLKNIVEPNKNIITSIQKSSNEAVIDWKTIIDMVFIDGDHSEQGVLDDCANWLKFVKKGGYALFHDYGNTGCEQVKKVVESFCMNDKWELIDIKFTTACFRKL